MGLKINVAAVAMAASLITASNAESLTVLSGGVDTPPVGQQLVSDFDGLIAPSFNLILNGPAGIFDGLLGLISGIAAPPPGTTSHYLAIQQGGNATLFTPLLSELSVYIGSPDSYNSIRFIGLNGYDETLSGSALAGGSFNGDQSIGRRMTYQFGDHRVTQVIFSSSGHSFELDNIAATIAPQAASTVPAAASVVPEPATWLMMIAGVGVAGIMLRRRRRLNRTPGLPT